MLHALSPSDNQVLLLDDEADDFGFYCNCLPVKHIQLKEALHRRRRRSRPMEDQFYVLHYLILQLLVTQWLLITICFILKIDPSTKRINDQKGRFSLLCYSQFVYHQRVEMPVQYCVICFCMYSSLHCCCCAMYPRLSSSIGVAHGNCFFNTVQRVMTERKRSIITALNEVYELCIEPQAATPQICLYICIYLNTEIWKLLRS